MKLLIVINSLATGGAEKLLMDTIPSYHKEGFRITLVVLNGSETVFLKKLEGLKVCEIVKLSKGSVYNPMHIFRLKKILKKFKLVHVHLFPSLYWVAIANMFQSKKTVLFFSEHNTSNRRKGWLFKRFDNYIYSKYTKVIAIAAPVKKFLENKLNLKHGQLTLINNGVEISTFKNANPLDRSAFSLTKNHKILIQVASFTEQKDQDTLIRTMNHLDANVHLLLVGDGPRKGTCNALVDNLQLDERVQFLGIRTDVPKLLKMADAIVLSSYFEGLSLSSIEAMASGTPFIASNVPGLASVVEGAGVLFEQGNETELANKIKALLNDKEYSVEIAEKGFERAQLYSIDKMVKKHVALYKEYGQT